MSAAADLPILWYTLAFGKDEYHAEAMAMLLSAAAVRSPRSRFRVYTDKPAWYAWMEPITEVRELDAAKTKAWAGEPPFVLRVKAQLIAAVAAEHPGASVWLDTDMWAVAPLEGLERELDAGHPLMYFTENPIAKGITETERKYRAFFREKWPQLLPSLHQWNSGVVGLPAGRSALAREAVELLDEMSRGAPAGCYTREQMAISATLCRAGGLRPCDAHFRHYFGPARRSLWVPLLKKVCFQIAVNQRDPAALLDWVRALPPGEIPPQRSSWLERKKRSLRKNLGLLAPTE